MNKYISSITLSIALILTGCATTEYKAVEIESIVNVPNQDQKSLFKKTRQWFSQYFVSGESVIDYEDQESGTIIGNGIASNGADSFGIISYGFKYNIRIDTKDNKFRALTKIYVLIHIVNTFTFLFDFRNVQKGPQAYFSY